MNGLDNETYLAALIASNLIAILMLWASTRHERLARLLFFVLFAWASWTNWSVSLNNPSAYLEYADLTFLPLYKKWILGWFSENIGLYVGIIATCQALIAVSMWLKGWIVRAGAMGAIIFLLAIVPLGVGSAFPATLIMAVAMMYILRRRNIGELWASHRRHEAA